MNDLKQKPFYKMFLGQLQEVYSAEIQFAEVFPLIINTLKAQELKDLLKFRIESPDNQKKMLGEVYDLLGETPHTGHSDAMRELVRECRAISESALPQAVRDAQLIAALQKIMHYEIASFGSLHRFAAEQNLDAIAHILSELLHLARDADERLTEAAEGGWFRSGIDQKAIDAEV